MKATRVILLGVTLAALMVPLAYAIFFIGPVNYVASHGGNVTFAQNFQATSLTYPDGLSRFTSMIWGGTMLGNLGFDVGAGANMTVTAITANSVTYTITTLLPGNRNSYLYYWRSSGHAITEPLSVTGGTYTYAGGIATVTTLGSPVVVVVSYGTPIAPMILDAASVLIALIPFLVLAAVINDARNGDLGPGTLTKIVLIVLILAAFAWIIQGWGY